MESLAAQLVAEAVAGPLVSLKLRDWMAEWARLAAQWAVAQCIVAVARCVVAAAQCIVAAVQCIVAAVQCIVAVARCIEAAVRRIVAVARCIEAAAGRVVGQIGLLGQNNIVQRERKTAAWQVGIWRFLKILPTK